MPKIEFDYSLSFTEKSLAMIENINLILLEYEEQGFDLTLRQLYYQLVARDMIENTQKSYKRIGALVGKARMAGCIDWDHLVDRTRNVKTPAFWNSPQEIVETCADQFKIDLWKKQPQRVEVWIEKDALVGVFEGICNRMRLPLFSCRGYTSLSEMYSAGNRIRDYGGNKPTIILHFGDHDPSGIDMTRDIRERLNTFAQRKVVVERIALNMEQIEEFNPPPNPAKLADSRAKDYCDKYGNSSWELDALTPSTLESLVERNVNRIVDGKLWNESLDRENELKTQLQYVSDNWMEVIRGQND